MSDNGNGDFIIPIADGHGFTYTGPQKPPNRNYRYICLACLQRRQVTYTTSPRMLCRTHGAQFREWRRRHKLPAARARAYLPRTDPDQRQKRERQILCIMRNEGPIKLKILADKLPWANPDQLRYYLQSLEKQGRVTKVGKSCATKWMVAAEINT